MMYGVPQGGQVRISVYDVRGQLVRVLVDETMNAGMHQVEWLGVDDSGRQVSSGLYIARMQYGSVQRTRNMTLIR